MFFSWRHRVSSNIKIKKFPCHKLLKQEATTHSEEDSLPYLWLFVNTVFKVHMKRNFLMHISNVWHLKENIWKFEIVGKQIDDILKFMKVTAFCSQKWSSNHAAKLPRDVTLVADYIVILKCFFSTTFTTRRAVRKAKFGLVTTHFFVFERDSLRHVECNQNLCNQRDVKTRSSLQTLFNRQIQTLGGKNSDFSAFNTIRFWAFRKVHYNKLQKNAKFFFTS